ncbi:hypothetical protein KL942_002363 [Ogataea angusta]|uniref:Uncharacterized protein n=1 Tax=Pichia angusta TaxID=870730 RepID=A0ABQ7RYX9_PICAN|nr:hypothetical protein KL942_002363 [Ogataea angusta]KAG7848793.1 hypothetical protein KL941_001611 [Ogataea angusta]KAG7850320.1 hypothetical protein KL940_001880 [Ogataea angusta]KAG7861429.1 hypothetical protein KL919_002163 [Ogataea angusta]
MQCTIAPGRVLASLRSSAEKRSCARRGEEARSDQNESTGKTNSPCYLMADIRRANAGENLIMCQGYAVGRNCVLVKVANKYAVLFLTSGGEHGWEKERGLEWPATVLGRAQQRYATARERPNGAVFRVLTGVNLFVPDDLVCIT